MNIQIFGRKNCFETKKAQRWFKERRIPFQFVDLKIKGMSKRELESVSQKTGWENLVDKESNRFQEKGLAVAPPSVLPGNLLEDPLLIKTPVVRNGKEATVGFSPLQWKEWK